VFTAKDAAETAFRNAAGGSCLFTGWTQALIRSLNELHARIRPGMTMAEATRVLTTEAVVFAAMGDAAAEMAAMVREAEANGSQKG
jgi:predicted ATPase